MNRYIKPFNTIITTVTQIFSSLKLTNRTNPKGRKPALTNIEAVAVTLFARTQNIATKRSLFQIVEPSCSYNTFVCSINRTIGYLARVVVALLSCAGKNAHLVKLTDATDIPVCMVKNAKHHRTMRGLAAWSKTGKGWFFGLKLHLSADVKGEVLALKLTPGNSDDRAVFRQMNEKLRGIFVADAGYISEKLAQEFAIEGERLLITSMRANMRKVATRAHIALLNLRMRVEVHFRTLKLCYGLVTSFPRSVDGYLAHYIAAVCAYLIA